jgi:hypothetical protein
MEDETSRGNDDIRTLILSTLSTNGMNRVHCVVCANAMPIFERFPLIDGTFFLSPRQHSKAAVKLVAASIERKFLNAVCMGCLEGWNSSLKCRSCRTKWDGSHLILGSMYSYDIFAAVPCCISRLKCANCNNLAISPGRRLEFFSDYSQNLACSHCGVKDFHFVKPLNVTFMQGSLQSQYNNYLPTIEAQTELESDILIGKKEQNNNKHNFASDKNCNRIINTKMTMTPSPTDESQRAKSKRRRKKAKSSTKTL